MRLPPLGAGCQHTLLTKGRQRPTLTQASVCEHVPEEHEWDREGQQDFLGGKIQEEE